MSATTQSRNFQDDGLPTLAASPYYTTALSAIQDILPRLSRAYDRVDELLHPKYRPSDWSPASESACRTQVDNLLLECIGATGTAKSCCPRESDSWKLLHEGEKFMTSARKGLKKSSTVSTVTAGAAPRRRRK